MFYKKGDVHMENFMLKVQRLKTGLDEAETAALAHMTKKDYIAIENNTIEPKLKDMVSISNVFHATMEELFDWNPSV